MSFNNSDRFQEVIVRFDKQDLFHVYPVILSIFFGEGVNYFMKTMSIQLRPGEVY